MRALLVILPVVLAGCSTDSTNYSISQREILKRSQAEIARREPWAGTAAIIVQNPGEISRVTWKVRAGAYDFSDYPRYNGIYFVPGTERELRFSSDGCLTKYSNPRRPCETVVTDDSAQMVMIPEK
ncbi:MAG: hypothetical protein V4819_18305 [Verrucomicrobiota bacterium]